MAKRGESREPEYTTFLVALHIGIAEDVARVHPP